MVIHALAMLTPIFITPAHLPARATQLRALGPRETGPPVNHGHEKSL
ncbi:hypothetical protein PACID_22840 [Acidipropionibacterium acidipropionici ATCC 4875]|uniref:Uncharacterized protein n=1 Tax=Acidipropionibacterium acidipropionici (strain ATCC 4875 / DSM 20272 / JCM 6432 / NBRC 12425 / NCIMB 8070 / 4) TaxID=1171373 RepID=K7S5Z0_ACIA4|nr:hypothetical protein PACID_22840 [Acidipropionibacterium acidipropionici ATCC 4875]